MKKVIKYNGKEALRRDCRKIAGEFYEKNIDCFLIDGKWNRINNGLIVKNYRTGEYIRKSSDKVIEGFVDFKDGKPVKGYFDINEDTIRIKNDFILNEEIALKLGYVPSINSEKWVLKTTPEIKKIGARYSSGRLPYNMDGNHIRNLNSNYKKLFNEDVKDIFLRRFLEGYKFGFEFETSTGYIRKAKLAKHGVMPLLDGSLRNERGEEPFEFTTIPYEGTKGVATLKSFADVLNMHCEHNLKCSIHIHISGYPTNRNNVMVLYKVLKDIEDDIFLMFPAYKNNPAIIDSRKNYCQRLPDIFKNLDIRKIGYENYINAVSSRMFQSLTGRTMTSRDNYARGTALFEGVRKWDIPGRYRWVNMIPLLFGNSKTVEFRIHEPTFDKNLLVNWLLFCISILKYAEKNTDYTFKNKVTLNDIFSKSDYGIHLKRYYEERLQFYKNSHANPSRVVKLIPTVKRIV